ncbi:MAG: ThuA domain-containing protein [Bacteroidetes bacterium]|nr:ThuA domain-containing protein [Bacteroidota bacterium]
MKTLTSLVIFLLFFFIRCDAPKQGATGGKFNVLVFSKTAGFRHASIPDGIAAIKKLGQENNFGVEATEDAAFFTKEKLTGYKVVVFLSTTLDVLNDQQQQAFEGFIRSGGGFLGIHAAADTEYEWPWYGKLVGGYFESHPKPQEAVIRVKNASHISTKHLPADWTCTDEWYNYKNLNPDVQVLCQLDESTYEGGKNGANHPIAWYHEYDGGRAFYTGRGHTPEAYSEPLFLQHVLGGILWAAGGKK